MSSSIAESSMAFLRVSLIDVSMLWVRKDDSSSCSSADMLDAFVCIWMVDICRFGCVCGWIFVCMSLVGGRGRV